MNELRDLLRRYQPPKFTDKKDLALSQDTLNTAQVTIRYGIKTISRLAVLAAQSDEYSESAAKKDMYQLGFLINDLMDLQQFAYEQEQDLSYKLELMEKAK